MISSRKVWGHCAQQRDKLTEQQINKTIRISSETTVKRETCFFPTIWWAALIWPCLMALCLPCWTARLALQSCGRSNMYQRAAQKQPKGSNQRFILKRMDSTEKVDCWSFIGVPREIWRTTLILSSLNNTRTSVWTKETSDGWFRFHALVTQWHKHTTCIEICSYEVPSQQNIRAQLWLFPSGPS